MIVNVMATKGKLPLSCSSNSSAPSSPSSSQQHKSQFTAALTQTQICENKHQHQHQHQHRHQVGSTPNWPGNKFEYGPEKEGDPTCRFNDNLELTDIDEDKPAESAPAVVREIQKEHMFYKVVTPSDVGKLNRLVIPKQHAEKYFPLDSSSNEKGLILNFEDRNGKSWRFRYSYWNSSQSYVMTKGWSRFVKDKKLDAGDIVYFQRGAGDLGKDRLYIDWRRRLDAPDPTTACYQFYCQQQQHQKQQPYSSIIPWSPLIMRPPPPTARLLARDPLHLFNLPPDRNAYHGGGSGSYSHSCSNYSNGVKVNPCSSFGTPTFYNMRPAGPAPRQQGGGGCGEPMPMVYESVPAVVQGKAAAAAKSLRLFGVNMVCPITTDQSNVDPCDELSSSNTIPPHATPQELPYQQPDPHVMSTYPPHELRLYNATPFPPIPVPADLLDKRKSSVSLDLDI